jgi:predicted nucleic acid-binding protein
MAGAPNGVGLYAPSRAPLNISLDRSYMPQIVLDTCVVVDMFMSTRPRHVQATQLRLALAKAGITARMPSFTLFELSRAIRQEKRLSNGKLIDGPESGEENGLSVDLVPIDEAFVHKYLDVNLPEMRAGDLTFAALAKGDRLPLVTEDAPLRKAAKAAGIGVFTIEEYLSELSKNAV